MTGPGVSCAQTYDMREKDKKTQDAKIRKYDKNTFYAHSLENGSVFVIMELRYSLVRKCYIPHAIHSIE